MSDRYQYVRIDDTNADRFSEYFPGSAAEELEIGGYGIGIMDGERPVGAVMLGQIGRTLTVQSIRTEDSSDGTDIRPEIFASLRSFGARQGYNRITCRYTDDEPGINEDMLRAVGFTSFEEEAHVFRIDAYNLGSLLRDSRYAPYLRRSAIGLMQQGRVSSFLTASYENLDLVRELHPAPDLSFLTVDETGILESFVVISEMPDGSLYLADLMCADGCEADLEGLLYMALGNAFMRIEPAGEFYIAGVNNSFTRLAEFFIAQVRPLIRYQKIMNAGMTL